MTLSPLKAKPLEWLPDFGPNTVSRIPNNPFSTQFDPAHLKRESDDFCRSMAQSLPWKIQAFGIFQPVNSRKSSQQEQNRGFLCLPVPLPVFQRYWVIRPGFYCLDYAPTNYRLFSYNMKSSDHRKQFGEANLLVFCFRAAQNCQTYPSLYPPSFVLLLLWISPGSASPGGCSEACQPGSTWRAPVQAP